MLKTATRNRHSSNHENYDFQEELDRIKGVISDTASKTYGNAKEKFKETSADFQEKLTNRMSEKPLQTLGYAMLCGLLLGYIARARRK